MIYLFKKNKLMDKLRREILENIASCNKKLSKDYLSTKSTRHLLSLCHPLQRDKFENRLNEF